MQEKQNANKWKLKIPKGNLQGMGRNRIGEYMYVYVYPYSVVKLNFKAKKDNAKFMKPARKGQKETPNYVFE